MECSFDGCDNQVFKGLNECALHCEKNKYEKDYPSGILSAFNHLLKKYILENLISNYSIDLDSDKVRREIIIYRENYNSLSNSSIFKQQLAEIIINFSNIYFPSRKDRDSYDYFKTLKMFRGVHFSDCKFSLGLMNLDSVEVFYEYCLFTQCYSVVNQNILDNTTNSIYSECDFIQRLDVSTVNINDYIDCTLFHNCIFRSSVSLSDTKFAKEVFVFGSHYSDDISSINIERCIFEDRFKLNGLTISNLNIEDAEFQSKFEVKQTTIKVLAFKNSNVTKIFDSFESKFIKAKFSRSIFSDFAGFEEVQFGLPDEDSDDKFLTVFEHVTFMNFSSFRGAKFNSGLDFSKTNLKDKPNFLNAKISPLNTKRETFRIIKNSFDDVGNKLEANKFFAEEMNAYKKELYDIKAKEAENIIKIKEVDKSEKVKGYKKTKGYKDSRRARWIFNANNFISEFGENYLRPTFILIVSVTVYTAITLWNKCYFKSHEYFRSWDWINNASWSQWYFDSHDYFMSWKWFDTTSSVFNEFAINILPFRVFIKDRNGIEFISLFFYIWFAVLIWQIIVSVKRHTQR